jgi:hypothetical protein
MVIFLINAKEKERKNGRKRPDKKIRTALSEVPVL